MKECVRANLSAPPNLFTREAYVSYWASLEIEMSLLGKRLSAGQFIKESVRAVK